MKSLTKLQLALKRFFDIVFSLLFIIVFGILLILLLIISFIKFRSNPIYKHKRLGYNKEEFILYKIKTYEGEKDYGNKYGSFLRKTKLNELPQFFNVLKGDMSIVGPRPDTKDFEELLLGEEKEIIFSIKPGITGPASIYFIDEEELLSFETKNTQKLREIAIKKVALNKAYIENYSFMLDFKYLLTTGRLILKRIVS